MKKRQSSRENCKVNYSDEDEGLAAPLLRSDSEEELGEQLSSLRMDSAVFSSGPMENPSVRRVVQRILQIRTVADALPAVFQVILTSGKMSAVVFLGGYLLFLALWFPIYLFSFLVSEIGIYILTICTVFFIGRSVIRLIAFPGSTQRVSSEIEKEFSKYSVRMLVSSSDSILDLGQAIISASKTTGNDSTSNPGFAYYEIPSLWKRAKSYKDRVIAVYAEVLHYIFTEGNDTSGSLPSDITKYGNNRLSGDIGDLSGLTLEARAEGKKLLEHLNNVLVDLDRLEEQAKSLLESTTGQAQLPSSSVRMIANSLVITTNGLRDYVQSLNPSPTGDPNGPPTDREDEDLTVDAVRRRFEEQNTSFIDSVKSGLASILPMLDPPLHTSIFGFDVQRGCMLARYRGARQLWVPRPAGGMLDVLHIPAKISSQPTHRNPRAVMYCNPNAGLIEVATGMSLAGGNVTADADGAVSDKCWTDFYSNLGFDVYLYNYAGFGRSYGSGYFGFGKTGGEEPYVEGVYGRVKRIVHGTFFGFGPTPDTLRADGLALATHLVSQLGVDSLVIHGESIGGVAASGTARKMSESTYTRDKVSLLICDRTFCNLEAVAQRLVGGWSAYAIRMLAPFWSTDVAGDYLAAACPKVVANDSADAIIADGSSLKSGIAIWKEAHSGAASTKGIGWMADAPVQYRMADWENVSVNDTRYVQSERSMSPPVWPSDGRMSLEDCFHFAACTKRLGKLASIEKKRFTTIPVDEEGGINSPSSRDDSACQIPIFLVWKCLACCEGLCGSALGVTVKGGFDCTVAWLCTLLTYGGQTVVEGMEHRHQLSFDKAKFTELGVAAPSDFDCRPPGYEKLESDTVVHPKPIPEVLDIMKKILEENPNDEVLKMVTHELGFVIGTLEYIVARLSAPMSLQASWKNRHLVVDGMMVGSFLNLHCGHNNPFSTSERSRLKDLLLHAFALKSS